MPRGGREGREYSPLRTLPREPRKMRREPAQIRRESTHRQVGDLMAIKYSTRRI